MSLEALYICIGLELGFVAGFIANELINAFPQKAGKL